MTNLKILLSGAGITTNTLASLLARQSQSPHAQGLNLKHHITILERAPSLRATGLQIDIRGPGVDVIRRMGLAETLRQKTVKEEGIQVVDARGRRRGWFPVSRSSNPNSTAGDGTGKETGNKTAKGKTSLSTEWELMRGDLCRVLYEDVLRNSSLSSRFGQGQGQGGNVEYRFNTTIQALREDADGVDVRFSNGESERFDIVVGGDGQGSRVRELLLDRDSSADQGVQVQGQNGGGGRRRERRGKDPFNPLGVYAGLFTTSWPLPPSSSSSSSSLYPEPVPQGQSEDQLIGTAYLTTHKRAIFTRRHRPDRVQIYLFARTDDPSFSALRHGHLDPTVEKALFRNHFQDAGWEASRLLEALDNAEDFYCERIGWVDMARWSSLSISSPGSGSSRGYGHGKGKANGGRIVLVGDAAYAPSVTTGMGTTAGIVGAYVLAGEIGRACSAISSSSASTSSAESTQAKREAIQTAVGEYERTLRPFVRYIQKDLARGSNAWDRLPETRFGVGVWNVMLGVSSWLRLDEFGSWVREDRGEEAWKVPVYDHGKGHGDGL